MPALALPAVGGKQLGAEPKEKPPPDFPVPWLTLERTRGSLLSAPIFSTGGKCPLQQKGSLLGPPFCVSQRAGQQ